MNKYQLNAKLIRKPSSDELRAGPCIVEKWIPISRSEFQQIRENPLRDVGVVKAYRDLMYSDKDGSHCIMLHIPIPKTKTDKISP